MQLDPQTHWWFVRGTPAPPLRALLLVSMPLIALWGFLVVADATTSPRGRSFLHADPEDLVGDCLVRALLTIQAHRDRNGGALPESLADVHAACPPDGSPCLPDGAVDPWGRPLVYRADRSLPHGYELRSLGADGEDATADDVVVDIDLGAAPPPG